MTASNSEKQYNLRAYLFFWIGQMLSQLGSNIMQFVIIIWIAWEYNSSLLLALSAVAGFAPFILITPFAGVLVDRWSRKKVIIAVDFAVAMTTTVLIFLFWIKLDQFWLLIAILVLGAIRAVFQAFHMPATEAIVPLLVPPEKLSRLNGWTWLVWGLIGIIGAPVAVFLLLYFEIYEVLLVDPLTFLIALIPALIIKIPSVKDDQAVKEKVSFKTEFAEGLGFIKERRGLLSLLSVFTAVNFFSQPFVILLPLFVSQVLSKGKTELAILIAVQNIGALAGSILMSTWKGFKRNVVGVVFGILVSWIAWLIVIFTPPADANALVIIALALLISGFTLPITNVSSQTIWQQVVPPDKMGRVMSVRTTIAWFVIPFGMLFSGILAEIMGIVQLFFVSAVLGVACLAYSWFMTGLPDVERVLLPTEAEIPAVQPSIIATET
ncbi:MAG: MFS transporter [Candidatus Thorarchaeota archaeon]